MNEHRIRQVIEIEQQAQDVYEQAVREAQQLPIQAEQEGQALIERARAEANEEAGRIISSAQSEEAVAHILTEAGQKTRQAETLATTNFERAVAYVVERIIERG